MKVKKCSSLDELKVGNIIRNLGSGNTYTVIEKGKSIVAIRSMIVTNPDEWEIININPNT